METIIKAPSYKILEPYQGKWVALSSDKTRVVASGETLEEVANKIPKSEKKVAYMKVTPFDISFAPNAI